MVVRADLYLLIFFLLIVIHKDRLGKVKGGNIRSVMQTVVSSVSGVGGGGGGGDIYNAGSDSHGTGWLCMLVERERVSNRRSVVNRGEIKRRNSCHYLLCLPINIYGLVRLQNWQIFF